MSFQTSVAQTQAFGRVGTMSTDGPRMSAGTFAAGSSGAYIGRYHTIDKTTGLCSPGGTIGSNIIAGGFAMMPNGASLMGDSSSYFTPSLAMPAGSSVTLMTMFSGILASVAASTMGDALVYNLTDGTIKSVAQGASAPSGWALIPNSTTVVGNTNAAAGVITARVNC